MNDLATKTNDWNARVFSNTRRLAFWTVAWTLTLAFAKFGNKFVWDDNTLVTGLTIFINLAIGIGMIVANKRHLDGLDELQKKITLEAMALSLGVGLVFGISYSLMASTHFLPVKVEISHLIILIALTYVFWIILGNRRYK